MKTTIDIPDELLRDAKAMAARRSTTLKAIITHALEREVYHGAPPSGATFNVSEDGIPYLPARGARVTDKLVERLREDEDA